MKDLIDAVYALCPDVRYVAVARDGELTRRERRGLTGASAGGHLSVAVEPLGDPLAVAAGVERRLQGLSGGRGTEGGR